MTGPGRDAFPPPRARLRRVLNTGCGPYSRAKVHPVFQGREWFEVRLDVDPAVEPDIVASVTDMGGHVRDRSMDAIWSSHNLEHLHSHEVPAALSEFRRVLKPDGFALMTTPDLAAVAQLLVDGRVDDVAYQSPGGAVTAIDMLFGHGASIERGHMFMAHNTGFTLERLGRLLLEAGFDEAVVTCGATYDLWALGLMPLAARDAIVDRLRECGLDFGG